MKSLSNILEIAAAKVKRLRPFMTGKPKSLVEASGQLAAAEKRGNASGALTAPSAATPVPFRPAVMPQAVAAKPPADAVAVRAEAKPATTPNAPSRPPAAPLAKVASTPRPVPAAAPVVKVASAPRPAPVATKPRVSGSEAIRAALDSERSPSKRFLLARELAASLDKELRFEGIGADELNERLAKSHDPSERYRLAAALARLAA